MSYISRTLAVTLLVVLSSAVATLPALGQMAQPSLVAGTIDSTGEATLESSGGAPSEASVLLADLVAALDSYRAHAQALAQVEINQPTETEDTAMVERLCLMLERDAASIEEKARALQDVAPAARRWLSLVADRANLAWGTAMAIRSVVAPPTPLERKREVLAVSTWLNHVSHELCMLIDGAKQDLELSAG